MLTTKLASFPKLFKTEEELRVALLGLLERMPNTTAIQHTHGVDEIGKDIVFDVTAAFAQKHTVACVVKRDKISGSVASSEGARTVYLQAEQCLDSPHLDISGVEKPITQVYVLCPHDCSPTTSKSIFGKLSTNAGRVIFLCGGELLKLFESHYPEFLIFQSGIYGSYIGDLEKGVQADPAVANLLLRSGYSPHAKSLADLYVQPRFSRSLFSRRLFVSRKELRTSFGSSLLDEESAVNAAFSYTLLGRLITAYTAPDAAGEKLGHTLFLISRDLYNAWKRALEEHKKRAGNFQREQMSKEKVLAPEMQDIMNANSTTITQALNILEEIEESARLANSFATRMADPAKRPTLIEQLAYGRLESAEKRVTGLIQSTAIGKSIPYAHTLLEDEPASDFLITAPAGFGKTSYCRSQTLRDLKMLRAGSKARIPIYVPLHQLPSPEITNFETDILRSDDLIELWKSRFIKDEERHTRRFRIYLDGIDEVPDEFRQKAIIEAVERAKLAEPDLQVVITGREHVSGVHLARFTRLRVNEMEDDQVSELVSKWFNNSDEEIQAFRKQINDFPQIAHVLKVPLLATLILGVYGSTETLPQSRVALYEMFVSLLAGGWDIAKKVQRETQFGPEPKITVLIKLAGMLHLASRRDANQSDFRAALNNTLPGLGEKSARMLTELVQDGLLNKLGESYAFCHLSFQEFLAAKDLFDNKGRKAKAAMRNYLTGHLWWRDVVSFYIALTKNPKEMEVFIHENAIEADSKANDDSVRARAEYLLRDLALSYPGAKPNYEITYKKTRKRTLSMFSA